MIFVDTNVFAYAVGRPHPLQEPARQFFRRCVDEGEPLVTSAEVLQELVHLYLPVDRMATLDAALELARGALAGRHPHLGARDLVHLACCRRREVTRAKTFDRGLAAAFGKAAE